MSKDDEKNDDEDINLFKEAMKNVKPLRNRKATVIKKSTPVSLPKKKRNFFEPAPQIRDNLFSDNINEFTSTDEKLFFTRGGLQLKLLRDFQQGKIRPIRTLDLHGMAVTKAREAVTEFLLTAVENNDRCVCIIHGKGKFSENHPPILKSHLNSWLRQYKNVLAFSSAQPKDGGTGALYVLLKREDNDTRRLG
jgi:DNA-nicking Smr family endonuclease